MNKITRVTQSGSVKGFFDDGIYKWLGIPYAKPPVGELRFRRSQRIEPWSGVHDATKFSAKAIQPKSFMVTNDLPQSEDCLYLNVWSPDPDGEKKPVFVWIHGGACVTGEGSLADYDGSSFAKNGVVYVTFNYRINALGIYDFAAFPKGEGKFDTNCILSDQINALKWIKENIEVFGGDPENITICGESAGGLSVMCLMVSPAAKGLFNKAISESGLPEDVHSPEVIKEFTKIFLNHIGLDENTVEEVKNVDPKTLAEASGWLLNTFMNESGKPGIMAPAMVIDDLLPVMPLDAIASGEAKDISLIIGTNRNESTLFIKPGAERMAVTVEDVDRLFSLNKISEEKKQEILSVYKNYPSREAFAEMGTDYTFLMHNIEFADLQKSFADTWMFRFDYRTPTCDERQMGSFHTWEICFALNTWGHGLSTTMVKEEDKVNVKKLTNKMHNMWINFAKYGNPNGVESVEEWPKYDDDRLTYVFDKECRTEADPSREARVAWDRIKLYR